MDLYIDPTATTSRAVLALCIELDLAIAIRPVSLMKGEHHQPPLSTLNPNRLVPVLDDRGFVLTESSAILRYLARRAGSPLYPADLQAAARVDERIAWFESNFYRDFGFQYIYPQLMPHHGRGSDEATRATIEWGRSASLRWLQVLDAHFLAGEDPWLAGKQPTIADFHGASILSLAELVGADLTAFGRVRAWLDRMETLASWRRACEDFRGFAQSLRGHPWVGLHPRPEVAEAA
jgi:glutathione S-transferase